MDGSAKAAEAAVTFNPREASSARIRSRAASFRERGVSAPRADQPQRHVRESRRMTVGAIAAGGAQGGMRSRTVAPQPDRGAMAQPVTSRPRPSLREPLQRSPNPVPAIDPAAVPAWKASPRFAELPWLTPERNVERFRTNRLLGALERPDRGKASSGELRQAVELVSEVEHEIRCAHEMLAKSRTALLSDTQWRDMAFSVLWLKEGREMNRDMLQMWLGLASESEAADAELPRMARDLKQRLDDAYRYLLDQPWDDCDKGVKITLPGGEWGNEGEAKSIEFRSRVIPGAALGSSFAQGYTPFGSDGALLSDWKHLPGLVHSKLLNAGGETLYSGLGHSIIELELLDAITLTEETRSVDRLKSLQRFIRDVQFHASAPEEAGLMGGLTKEELIRGFCTRIRRGGLAAVAISEQLRSQASLNMGREVAVAALVTDQAKFKEALHGKTVDIRLCSVVSIPDRMALNPVVSTQDVHAEAFAALKRLSPVELRVRGPDGALRTVRANVKVRRFIFARGDSAGDARRIAVNLCAEWGRLLGSVAEPELGGDVKASADAKQARILELRDAIATADRYHERLSSARRGGDLKLRIAKTRAGLQEHAESLERNCRTLVATGEMAKALARYKTLHIDRYGPDPDWFACEMMMSQLMSIACLMGETPVLCYRNAAHLHMQDSAVKLFAAATDNTEMGAEVWAVQRAFAGIKDEFRGQIASQYRDFVGSSPAMMSARAHRRSARAAWSSRPPSTAAADPPRDPPTASRR